MFVIQPHEAVFFSYGTQAQQAVISKQQGRHEQKAEYRQAGECSGQLTHTVPRFFHVHQNRIETDKVQTVILLPTVSCSYCDLLACPC
jgi:hypothetical protein